MRFKSLQPRSPSGGASQNPILRNRESLTLLGLILFQTFCTVFFLTDVLGDMEEVGWATLQDAHILPELMATIGLIAGIVMLSRNLVKLLRRQSQIEESLSIARGALGEVMEGYYRTWGLTASEQDIATFTIKGYSIAEIAQLRGSAEATVKTHLNAIYRKSGTSGRGQLTSLLIEDLLGSPLLSLAPGAQSHARPNGRSSAEAAE
ncbi:LuxR C-terminal-related transcriptional regulator [Tabrizicola sp. J26]|uniref:helix-turn-helix transcriptional regulator n=1 Tax=Alitabrizicola rongguiensis TaxID=2909234 RepID=UPI001F33BFA6|nr:helix-turn-helix transcriptional regulator [Tabrizicola rongguiensis]MCF1710020.1 LuxR C-terminal-related transcriptional regulator [Tabrizicola rongguiensis]